MVAVAAAAIQGLPCALSARFAPGGLGVDTQRSLRVPQAKHLAIIRLLCAGSRGSTFAAGFPCFLRTFKGGAIQREPHVERPIASQHNGDASSALERL